MTLTSHDFHEEQTPRTHRSTARRFGQSQWVSEYALGHRDWLEIILGNHNGV